MGEMAETQVFGMRYVYGADVDRELAERDAEIARLRAQVAELQATVKKLRAEIHAADIRGVLDWTS